MKSMRGALPPTRAGALVGMVALAAACGPVVRSTPLGGDYEPRPDSQEILVFSVRTPECDFEEIGLVTARTRGLWGSMAGALEALKERARRMGGDAVAGLSQVPDVQDDDAGAGLTGTVIRFTDPACRR